MYIDLSYFTLQFGEKFFGTLKKSQSSSQTWTREIET